MGMFELINDLAPKQYAHPSAAEQIAQATAMLSAQSGQPDRSGAQTHPLLQCLEQVCLKPLVKWLRAERGFDMIIPARPLTAEIKNNTGKIGSTTAGGVVGFDDQHRPSDDWCRVERTTPRDNEWEGILVERVGNFVCFKAFKNYWGQTRSTHGGVEHHAEADFEQKGSVF